MYIVAYPELTNITPEPMDTGGLEDSNEVKPEDTTQAELHHVCAPYCLLYNSEEKKLIPVAIKLRSDGDIYTKDDDIPAFCTDWNLAKSHVLSAHLNSHLLVNNIGLTLGLEPVEKAVLHNLPSVHPVHKLLHPYLAHTLEHSQILHKHILSDDGLCTKYLGVNSREDALNLLKTRVPDPFTTVPNDLKNRGVDSEEHLPDYHYRHDALLVWDALLDYTNKLVCHYYSSDGTLEQDTELQNFLEDVRKHDSISTPNVPEKFTSREQLSEFLSAVIFQVSFTFYCMHFVCIHEYFL